MLVGSGVLNGNLSDHGRNARPAIVCRSKIPIPASDLKEKLKPVGAIGSAPFHFHAISREDHSRCFMVQKFTRKDLFHFIGDWVEIGLDSGERAKRCRAFGIWQIIPPGLAPLAPGAGNDDSPTGFWRVLVQVDRIRFAPRADDFNGMNSREAGEDVAGLF